MRIKPLLISLLALPFSIKANNGITPLNQSNGTNKNVAGTISQFYGEVQYGIATVYWKTYERRTPTYFVIEKSENGKDFKCLDSISNNESLTFLYKDTTPIATGFYRIKSIDQDTVYSDVIRLSALNGMPQIAVSPEIFDVSITVDLTSQINEEFTISLSDSKGKILSSRLVNAGKGANKIVFEDGMSFLYADEYTISVTAMKYAYSRKLYKR